EQVERFDRDISALEGTLQERPEVLAPVSVDLAVHVPFGVVDDVVNVVGAQAVVREQFVGVDSRTTPDVFADVALQGVLAVVGHNVHADGAVVPVPVAREQPLHGTLAHSASALDDALPAADVHVASLATDVGFVYFDVPANLPAHLVLHGEPDA